MGVTLLQSPHSSRHSALFLSHPGTYNQLETILPRHIAICRAAGRGSFHAPSCPNRFLSRGWDEPLPLFPFPLFTLLVHRCVPIAYTGVNRRDRHLCIRTRQISVDLPRRTIPTFAAAGKDHLLPQENFFWCRRKIRRVAASEPSPGAKRPSLNPQPIRG